MAGGLNVEKVEARTVILPEKRTESRTEAWKRAEAQTADFVDSEVQKQE